MAERQDNEFNIPLPDGGSLRTPAYPQPCSYVRLLDADKNEVAYWHYNDWMEDETQAQEVMGAFIGSLGEHWASGGIIPVNTEGIGDIQKALLKRMVCPCCHEPADPALILDMKGLLQISREGVVEAIPYLTFDHSAMAMCSKCDLAAATMNDWIGKPRETADHKQVTLEVNGFRFEVDEGISDMIYQIWTAGVQTEMSCQDNRHLRPDHVWISFVNMTEARNFIKVCRKALKEIGPSYFQWEIPSQCLMHHITEGRDCSVSVFIPHQYQEYVTESLKRYNQDDGGITSTEG